MSNSWSYFLFAQTWHTLDNSPGEANFSGVIQRTSALWFCGSAHQQPAFALTMQMWRETEEASGAFQHHPQKVARIIFTLYHQPEWYHGFAQVQKCWALPPSGRIQEGDPSGQLDEHTLSLPYKHGITTRMQESSGALSVSDALL